MAAFAKALPAIRWRVHQDLALPGLPRAKVLATVMRVHGERVQFRFRGKRGVRHDIELTDLRLARIVQRMQDLPGEELIHSTSTIRARRAASNRLS